MIKIPPFKITEVLMASHVCWPNGYQYNKTRSIAYRWCNARFSDNISNIPTNIFILDI